MSRYTGAEGECNAPVVHHGTGRLGKLDHDAGEGEEVQCGLSWESGRGEHAPLAEEVLVVKVLHSLLGILCEYIAPIEEAAGRGVSRRSSSLSLGWMDRTGDAP